MQACEFKLKENSTIKKSHMNASVAIQDQLKTIEVSVLYILNTMFNIIVYNIQSTKMSRGCTPHGETSS
jgi:hypothetical protein